MNDLDDLLEAWLQFQAAWLRWAAGLAPPLEVRCTDAQVDDLAAMFVETASAWKLKHGIA